MRTRGQRNQGEQGEVITDDQEQTENEAVEEQRVEINALIDDGIRVTATSAIPSCEIITVDGELRRSSS